MRKVIVRVKEKPAPQPEAAIPEGSIWSSGVTKEELEAALRHMKYRKKLQRAIEHYSVPESMDDVPHEKPIVPPSSLSFKELRQIMQ